MTQYDFKCLSSDDFEVLIRDLLQKHMGITMESFKAGRDKGIDLRYSPSKDDNLIVQCKHYAETGYKGLLTTLKKEAIKVGKIKPKRYIIATSVPLSPQNKEEIKCLFSPYSKSTTDIFGKEDINNLLGKHPEIERQHFKLWLTSTTVLERILHSRVYSQSELAKQEIKKKIKYYVQNESFFIAKKLLKEHNYCIISGIPGIGKTFLAEMLLVYYTNRDYEPFKITSDISEAFSVLKSSERQVFYYDDFLGQTGLEEKLSKNEDQALIDLINYVQKNKNTKFILTTREYILKQAKATYERLATSNFDIWKCVVELESYTRMDRAKILYNHLYFSDLPSVYIDALLSQKRYLKIIDHKNYSPRIIEWMTKIFNANEWQPNEYPARFFTNLDNPSRLWKHAFERQISNASRHLLLVLCSFKGYIFINDLENAFNKFYQLQSAKYSFQSRSNDFKEALYELEGTFLKIERTSKGLIIGFHNPSIRDYLETYLSENADALITLCASSVFYEQILHLTGIKPGKPEHVNIKKTIEKAPDVISNGLVRSVRKSLARWMPRQMKSGREYYSLAGRTIEQNIIHALQVSAALPEGFSEETASQLIQIEINRIRDGTALSDALPTVIEAVRKHTPNVPIKSMLESCAGNYVTKNYDNFDDIEQFETVVNLDTIAPGIITKDIIEQIKEKFKEDYEDLFDSKISEAAYEDEFDVCDALVDKFAEYFDIDLEDIHDLINDHRHEILHDFPEDPDPDVYYWKTSPTTYDTIPHIDDLFDSLRER